MHTKDAFIEGSAIAMVFSSLSSLSLVYRLSLPKFFHLHKAVASTKYNMRASSSEFGIYAFGVLIY